MFYVGANGPVIEKDPEIQKLRDDVQSRMWDIVRDEVLIAEIPDTIKTISFEEALKELVAMKNS